MNWEFREGRSHSQFGRWKISMMESIWDILWKRCQLYLLISSAQKAFSCLLIFSPWFSFRDNLSSIFSGYVVGWGWPHPCFMICMWPKLDQSDSDEYLDDIWSNTVERQFLIWGLLNLGLQKLSYYSPQNSVCILHFQLISCFLLKYNCFTVLG